MQMRLVIVIKGGKTVLQEKHYLEQNIKARQLGAVPRTSTPLLVGSYYFNLHGTTQSHSCRFGP